MNEQFNRRAMIRRVRAKSSLCYPEVVHRFCGYLATRENFFQRRRARVVKRETDELSRAAKKISRAQERGCRSGFSPTPSWVRLQPDSLSATPLLREPCSGGIRGENAVACTHQPARALESPPVGPVAQWLVQGTHRQRCLRGESREVDGMNSGNPSGRATDGNPEPSRRYTAGRCRDYLRATVPLMTGKSVPHTAATRATRSRG